MRLFLVDLWQQTRQEGEADQCVNECFRIISNRIRHQHVGLIINVMEKDCKLLQVPVMVAALRFRNWHLPL
jgi:hypothetical protein